MADLVALTLADGQANLAALILELSAETRDWNEADTRFQIIDRILMSCLGWSRSEIKLEKSKGKTYTDYELGQPTVAIWEAKREGKTFEIPARKSRSLVQDLASVKAVSKKAKEAIEQVEDYCNDRGVRYAVATNGRQFIAFRVDNAQDTSVQRQCLFVESLDHLQANFARIWQTLSSAGISEEALDRLLDRAEAPQPPQKLSTAIPNYSHYQAPTELQRSLSDLAELLLLDVEFQPEIEEQFYENCYCESGALSQHALISKKMLQARYEALFPQDEVSPKTEPVVARPGRPQFTPEVLAEAVSNRPIALLGDVGVGKSSFLKHLMYISAFDEFQHAMYIYVDLGRKGALSHSLLI